MRCLVVVQDEGWAVLCSLNNKMPDMTQIAGTREYISLLPNFTSILSSTGIKHTASILNYVLIT